MENIQLDNKQKKIKLDFKDSKYATGRRKKSIAKVWLKKGSGKIYVNGKLYSDYFVKFQWKILRKLDEPHCSSLSLLIHQRH